MCVCVCVSILLSHTKPADTELTAPHGSKVAYRTSVLLRDNRTSVEMVCMCVCVCACVCLVCVRVCVPVRVHNLPYSLLGQ